jgi:mannose-1-phosphate guanylyltransferase
LPIVGREPIIKQTYDRLREIIPPERIYICTGGKWKGRIEKIFAGDKLNFILEPFSHDTLNAFLLSAYTVREKDSNGIVGIFPCDHFIRPEEEFINFLESASRYAENHAGFILGGINPTYPAT